MDMFKHVCWLHTRFDIFRYLMANTEGRLDGAEKACRHIKLCTFYVAAVRGIEIDMVRKDFATNDDFEAVHERTQDLTSFMDEQIGFPLEGTPDYDKLAPMFFDKFHSLAMKALDT